MGMTIVEKIFASRSDREVVRQGDLVVVRVDTAVPIDLNFYDGLWFEPATVFDSDRVAVIFDHIIPAPNDQAVVALDRGRDWARRMGVTKVHDVGPGQGICHQIIADVPYAKPGEILVCIDSHTCSGGALNCAARGIGAPELVFVLCKGYTWFQVNPTIRYELRGRLRPGVAAKDVFLHLAAKYGDHVMKNIEFGGPGLASLTMDQRRTLTTMSAEISAEFSICEPDAVLERHLADRGVSFDGAIWPDLDAEYEAVRELDLDAIEAMVGLPDALVNNTVPVGQVAGVKVNRAFVGSCSNGTLDDIREVAAVLRGRRVDPSVTMIVTPASQEIYGKAVREGLIEILVEAGVVVTASSCGMCAGFEGRLGPGDVCIASSTRNFKGRMGDGEARIYLASSATVAASAVAGVIAGADDSIELLLDTTR